MKKLLILTGLVLSFVTLSLHGMEQPPFKSFITIHTSDANPKTGFGVFQIKKLIVLGSTIFNDILADNPEDPIKLPAISEAAWQLLHPMFTMLNKDVWAYLSQQSLLNLSTIIHSTNYLDIPDLFTMTISSFAKKLVQNIDAFLKNENLLQQFKFPKSIDLLIGQKIALHATSNKSHLDTFQERAEVAVSGIAFSPDRKTFASCSNDRTITLWDLETKQCIYTLRGHTNWVNNIAFSSDGKIIASCSDDQTIKLWNVENKQCIQTLIEHAHDVNDIAFSPNGKILASCSHDQTIKLWDLETNQGIYTLRGHTDAVRNIAFHPNGKILASCSNDQTIKLWNLETNQCIKTLKGHTEIVTAIAFSPNGKILASCSADETIILWDLEIYRSIRTLTEHTCCVTDIAFHPNGKILASCSNDKTIKLWDLETNQCINTLAQDPDTITTIAFSSYGTLVVGSHAIQLWNPVPIISIKAALLHHLVVCNAPLNLTLPEHSHLLKTFQSLPQDRQHQLIKKYSVKLP